MERFNTLKELTDAVKQTMADKSLTYQQQTSRLAKLAENACDYPITSDHEFYHLYESLQICDLDEGHAPYAPRYILPNYQRLLDRGSKFLRLEPAKTLEDALDNLIIFYHHVPSITRFPVFIGRLDILLEPFMEGVSDERANKEIRRFLVKIDRTIMDSFCHANIGPAETRIGNIILDNLAELNNATPNMTLLYDENITPDAFAEKAIVASMDSANPAFANHRMYSNDFGSTPYGIASCYNAMPTGGGAFTLTRLRLNKIAEASSSVDNFFAEVFPHTIDIMLDFMDQKIKFLVEQTAFFKHSFLVTEGFVTLDNFVGLFGIVGLAECAEKLAALKGECAVFGTDEIANDLGQRVMDTLDARVKGYKSKYSAVWDNRFMLHAQVGAASDEGTTPASRIRTGEEPDMYSHIAHAARYHKYFPSGVGDHFPFEETAIKNPAAVLDIFKAAFKLGMRYISSYGDNADLIRVTGYLVKKSDVATFKDETQVYYDTVQYAQDAFYKHRLLQKAVRSANGAS